MHQVTSLRRGDTKIQNIKFIIKNIFLLFVTSYRYKKRFWEAQLTHTIYINIPTDIYLHINFNQLPPNAF